jgi:glycerophosphoryl diester phosphodiesterase
MIDQKVATRKMIDRCKALNKKVLAWTVDNPEMVLPLLDRGVDGIITDNPPIIAARLNEIRGLSSVQRLILRARNALAD